MDVTDTDVVLSLEACGRDVQEEWNKGLGTLVGIYKKEDGDVISGLSKRSTFAPASSLPRLW
jgi:hypothetical protein